MGNGKVGTSHNGRRGREGSDDRVGAVCRRHGHTSAARLSGPAAVTPEDRNLLLLLRRVQWSMDEAALDMPRNTYSAADHVRLADALELLAHAVRQRLPRLAESMSADTPESEV
jgi:hypothetical protein